ncbi:MAG: DUF5012 domain-containing protein [Tannerella sp.]|jgi:hypothetical protein|nr:DUF5012 domain-containing protein [Tannerella sp.]
MKLYKYYLIIASVMLLFASCDKETEGVSRTTYYVDLELKGESEMFIPVGTSFTDPGVIAIEGDDDISESVKVSGNVNTNKAGGYRLTYTATNKDGFDVSVERLVIVYDPNFTTDVSGNYTVADGTYRLTPSSGAKISYSGYDVSITQSVPGIFYVSDYLGGYYEYRAGYGVAYSAQGYFLLNEDNTIEFISGNVAGWGDSVSGLIGAKYDPATNTLSWGAEYAKMIFYVTITK